MILCMLEGRYGTRASQHLTRNTLVLYIIDAKELRLEVRVPYVLRGRG